MSRDCIENLKSAQNPKVIFGSVVEMVILLVKRRLPGQRLDIKSRMDNYPAREEQSGKFSISSGSTRITTANMKKSREQSHFISVAKDVL